MRYLMTVGLLVGLIIGGLYVANACSAQGTAMTYSDDDPNDGGGGPEWMMGMAMPLAGDDDPNEPDEPTPECQ